MKGEVHFGDLLVVCSIILKVVVEKQRQKMRTDLFREHGNILLGSRGKF
jgi:hypothetical protein